MKAAIKFVFLLILSLLLLTGCAEKGQDYLDAVVTEVAEDYFLVECIDESSGNTTGSALKVPKDTVSPAIPAIAVGDTVRVVYSGVNKKDFPPEIQTVYAIYLVDENGNVITNE